MGSLEDEVRREIEEGMRQRAQVRYLNVSDHPALSEFKELLRKYKVPPVRFYKKIGSGTSMFGLGHPFTVYSAESEGWFIQKPGCDPDAPSTERFAFATTGEVYFDLKLERCINWYGVAQARGISSDDTIAVDGDDDLRFVSLANADRCYFGSSRLSGLERDYLRPALRQVLEHRVTKGIFILSSY